MYSLVGYIRSNTHVGVGGGGYGIIYGRGAIRGSQGLGVMSRVRVVVGQKHDHFRYQ